MATVKDVYNFIDSIAPFNTQEEWDNSGLLVGDENAKVTKILFALDVTTDVINQAITIGANLIVTHHPVLFKAILNVLSDSLVYKLINNNINIICAHTNYDKAIDGVNDILCKMVGINSFVKIENTCLNVGDFEREISTKDFVNYVKNALDCVLRYNFLEKNIKKIAVCSGSGSDYLSLAKDMDCDVLLTGDASHHAFLDANELNIVLVAAGHFETEKIAIQPLMNKVKENLNIECELAIQKSPIVTF